MNLTEMIKKFKERCESSPRVQEAKERLQKLAAEKAQESEKST